MTASTTATDAKGRLLLNGTVTLTNSGRWVVALQRVGVRLCSRETDGHIRETALCEPDMDVMAGEALVCYWQMTLPAPPTVGSKLADWTGVFRWASGD